VNVDNPRDHRLGDVGVNARLLPADRLQILSPGNPFRPGVEKRVLEGGESHLNVGVVSAGVPIRVVEGPRLDAHALPVPQDELGAHTLTLGQPKEGVESQGEVGHAVTSALSSRLVAGVHRRPCPEYDRNRGGRQSPPGIAAIAADGGAGAPSGRQWPRRPPQVHSARLPTGTTRRADSGG